MRKFTFEKIDDLAREFCGKPLTEAYAEQFGGTLPDPVNQSHQLVILASELDEASERIVEWLKTFPREEAKTFNGVFANQNIVCQLRHPETVEFLKREFTGGLGKDEL